MKKENGFTLIELSIVLVIIGLIIGGVLVGKDLIEASNLRKITSDKNMLQTAINTFRLKYNDMPGDMANATTYFGLAGGNGTTSCYNLTDTTKTCNGNGDKMIPCEGGANQCGEMARVMQHMALAGLIDGTYTGQLYSSEGTYYEGALNSYYLYRTIAPFYNIPSLAFLGFEVRSYSGGAQVGLLTAMQSYRIDQKIDDGDADEGNFLAYNVSGGSSCVSGSTSTTDGSANYQLSTTDKHCVLMFLK